MSEILTDRERKRIDQAAQDEKRILREIEESFCTAGYDVLESTVEHLGRKLKQA